MEEYSLWIVVPVALVAVNVVAFALFWVDKRKAQAGAWRVKERTLLMWCAFGGWPAGLVAMRKFRHKTRDGKFLVRYWGCVGMWVVGVVAGFWFASGE